MGDGVNIAARLEGIAKPGAICLSEDAYRQVRGKLDVAFTDLGPDPLKNIAEPMRIYSLDVGGPAHAKPGQAPAPEISRRGRRTLPRGVAFREHWRRSGTGLFRRWRDRNPHHRFVAHRWLFRDRTEYGVHLQGQAVDVKQIGRDLNVRYVLEGSVQRAETAYASMSSSLMPKAAASLGGALR